MSTFIYSRCGFLWENPVSDLLCRNVDQWTSSPHWLTLGAVLFVLDSHTTLTAFYLHQMSSQLIFATLREDKPYVPLPHPSISLDNPRIIICFLLLVL